VPAQSNTVAKAVLDWEPSFGGSCSPKDTRALVKIALDHDVPLRIVEAVLAVNDNFKRAMARKVANAVGASLRGKTIAVLGLTFKPDTDDMRADLDLPMIIFSPPASRADKARARHLCVDQHRIERGIERKPTDKPHRFQAGIARIIFTRTSQKLVECGAR
jgi:UDP-N-acetyl-D-mannosaminuronate dehydrogenase